MSEISGGPSFYHGPDDREANTDPNRLLIELARDAAHEMRSSEDLLTREIAEKIFLKAEIKERVDELAAHADDVTVYQEFKRLGIFVVRDAEAAFGYEDEASGFSIRRGDRYLDLHIPPVPAELRSRDAVRASLDLIGQYIALHGRLEPKYVMGVTYERMAKLAQRRFGFDVAYPSAESLPDGVVKAVQRVYEGFTAAGRSGADIGLPALVFRDTGSFLESHLSESQQPPARLGDIALGSGVVELGEV